MKKSLILLTLLLFSLKYLIVENPPFIKRMTPIILEIKLIVPSVLRTSNNPKIRNIIELIIFIPNNLFIDFIFLPPLIL